MKRCPQCDFIYEDDQSLCDMDGVLLVLDSRNIPVTAKGQPKRNRAVPAFATVILALVLGMVYYVSIHRRAAQNSYTPPSTASTANPTPEPQASQEVQVEVAPPVEAPKPESLRQPAASPSARKQPAKVSAPNKPEPEPKKDDSKVGSILKKTGRILKKPFKF
jgi:hypothetical protein